MVRRFNLKQSNALKHGVYSTIGLLPGESPAKFKKHQEDVIDEFRPNGPVEHDIVMTIACTLWRKQNLATFQTAQLVKFRYRQIIDEELKSRAIPSLHSHGVRTRCRQHESNNSDDPHVRRYLGLFFLFFRYSRARNNIGDVDGDHRAGVTKVRHDLFRSSVGHHNLLRALFLLVPAQQADGKEVALARIGICLAARGHPLVKEPPQWAVPERAQAMATSGGRRRPRLIPSGTRSSLCGRSPRGGSARRSRCWSPRRRGTFTGQLWARCSRRRQPAWLEINTPVCSAGHGPPQEWTGFEPPTELP
jgi:hypothetical protein